MSNFLYFKLNKLENAVHIIKKHMLLLKIDNIFINMCIQIIITRNCILHICFLLLYNRSI